MSSISSADNAQINTTPVKSQAWVFAGGDYNCEFWPGERVDTCDIIVGVDRGIEHCLDTGLVPDILMGDFDSVSPEVLSDGRLKNSVTKSYPSRKNNSDLELALHWLSEQSVSRVTLLGVSGGRSDHHLFNWLLPLQACWPFEISYIDASVRAYVVTPAYPLVAVVLPSQTISLLPMPSARGVCTQGLDYALKDAELGSGCTLGLSNVAVSNAIAVSVEEGQLWVFVVK